MQKDPQQEETEIGAANARIAALLAELEAAERRAARALSEAKARVPARSTEDEGTTDEAEQNAAKN